VNTLLFLMRMEYFKAGTQQYAITNKLVKLEVSYNKVWKDEVTRQRTAK
jgi:hypothetical protein